MERPNFDDYDYSGYNEYSADPRITGHDVMTALGSDADALMAEADVDVDELIRLINAETTVMPAIRVPDSVRAERAALADVEPEDELVTATKTWKKRFLKGAALAVLITLTGGGAAAMAMNKSVTVNVDGTEQSVNSYGDTVGEVLEDAGLTVGAHDSLSPSPQAEVGDGGVIKLERGRQLNVIVDGAPRESWVRATSVDEALTQLGMQDLLTKQGTWFSAPQNGAVPLEGMTLEIKTLKTITLYDGGQAPRELSTNALTTQELLGELNLQLGAEDKAESGLDAKLTDGAEVRVSRTGVSVINETQPIESPVEEIEDPEMEQGEEKVEEEGLPGEKIVTFRVTKKNDEEVGREEIETKVVKEPTKKVVRVGTKEPEQPQISDEGVWDRLAQCEATGNWAINTGNGFYGGLQFDKQTWNSYGGDAYAAMPHQASREQQIAIATKVRDDRGGYGAWPGCSSKLGLPR
ncbi:resuscitation-promoting factor [Amycolatopsis antarctica]|nr:resuscitation-promoting factor [Amycolatopsis antarctica]